MLKKFFIITIICASVLFVYIGKRANGKWVQSPNAINSSIDDYTTNDDKTQENIKNKDTGQKVVDIESKPNADSSVSYEEIISQYEDKNKNEITVNEALNNNEFTLIQPSHEESMPQTNQNNNVSSVSNQKAENTASVQKEETKPAKVCKESVFKSKTEAVSYGESHMKYDTSFSVIDYVDECGKMYYELDITFRIQTPGYPKTIDETQVMSFDWNKYDEDTMKCYINNDCSIDVSMSYFGKTEKQKLIEYYNNGYFSKESKPECYSEIEHELN